MSERLRLRVDVWRAHGANRAQLRELLRYSRNGFELSHQTHEHHFPLADEPFVSAWQAYVEESRMRGVFDVLRERLVQLRFPIMAGISETGAYQAAVRRGVVPTHNGGLRLRAPDRLQLFLQMTAAGRVPVLVAEERADFVALAQALAHHNEPVVIPDSVGALTIGGYNNWDRVNKLRLARQQANPTERCDDWGAELSRIAAQKELYQDRFILLSSGPYSATAGRAFGYSDEEWLAISLRLRLVHECTHYFTRRVLGSMRNNLLDELIADYAAIVSVTGRFKADWFLQFMGFVDSRAYRRGGRLENYRGKPPLSAGAFRVLQRMVRSAALGVERMDAAYEETAHDFDCEARRIMALAVSGLEEMSCKNGVRQTTLASISTIT